MVLGLFCCLDLMFVFFFKQKTAYEMRISDWSSDVCSSDLLLDGAAITAFAAEVGGADILFNCGGFVHAGTILTTEEPDFDFSFDLNVKSTYRMIRAFLPAMIARGGGSIVNMASEIGRAHV